MSDPSDAAAGDEAPTSAGAEDGGDLAPAEAFSLLGDATRLAIVTTLHERGGPLQFSELFEALDVEDSGRFNYHVQKLVPHFVAKGEDGYELTYAGGRIASAVSAGTYTASPHLEPFEIDGECHDCGAAALWAAYEDEEFRVECRSCDRSLLSVPAPPSLAREREPEAVVEAFDRWSWQQASQEIEGLCSRCAGPVEPSIRECPWDGVDLEVMAHYDCAVCGATASVSLGGVATTVPTVRAFHDQRGASLCDRPYWEVEQFVAGEHVEVLERDPWRVRVSFYADGDACHVEFDADVEVREARVVPGGAPDE